MNLTIFGGTGATGQLLIEQALAAGHQVTAYARTPDKLPGNHPALHTVAGELTDTDAIAGVVRSADAVLSLLGPSNHKTAGTPIADGSRRIIDAMQTHEVRRLVVSATYSAPDPADDPNLLHKTMVASIRRFVPRAYRDIVATAQAVRDSGLDWTLVRVGLLTDGPATAHVAAGHLGHGVGARLTRRNFASFMLDQRTARRWSRQAPAISNPRRTSIGGRS